MEVKEDPGEQASKYRAQVLELQKKSIEVISHLKPFINWK